MEEKKVTKISLSTFFLIIAIIVMGVYIYKLNKDKTIEIQKSTEIQSQVNSLNRNVSDLQGKINIISDTINNNSTSNTSVESNTSVNSSTSSNDIDNKTQNTTTNIKESNHKENKEEIVGKWNAYKAINKEDATETFHMRDIFGSSYAEFGSYLELREDGTFSDAIYPVTDGSKSVTGSYTIERDYYEIGDCYIFLTYSDGSKDKLQRVYYDDSNTPYLVLDSLINDYQISFKK